MNRFFKYKISKDMYDNDYARRRSYRSDSRDYMDSIGYRDSRDYGKEYNIRSREFTDERSSDYARERDSAYRDSYDGHKKEKYTEDLEMWADKLKKHDKFKMSMQEVTSQAKTMGITFKDYCELEFYVTYLMMVSDYKSLGNDPRLYLSMAKEFLEDDDIEVSPEEKLCIYYYYIVKGKMFD